MDYRCVIYILLIIITTVILIYKQIRESNEMIKTDPSAKAWLGFLPYLIPFFLTLAAIRIVPIAIIIEIIIYFIKR